MFRIFIELNNQTAENQFDYLLCNFKPDEIYVKESNGFSVSSNVMKKAQKIESASELPKDAPIVLFLPKEARYIKPTISLLDFNHPVSATYIFGPNHRNLTIEEDFNGIYPDHIVYIPTDSKDEMYNWNAAAIVLWDRRYG